MTHAPKTAFHHYLGTWNNPPEDYKLQLCQSGATFVASQLEKEACTHAQFYLWFEKNPKSIIELKKKLRECHFDGITTKQPQPWNSYQYCTVNKPEDKRHTIIPDTQFEWGKKPHFKKGSCQEFQETLDNCKAGKWEDSIPEHQVKYLPNMLKLSAHYSLPEGTDHCRGTWIFGPTGIGKSRAARSKFGSSLYLKQQNKWFDNYRGELTIILEDLDRSGTCLGHLIKIWADRYPCHGEIKGATVALRHKEFVVTSQYLPKDLWGDDIELVRAVERRFKILTVVNEVDLVPYDAPEVSSYFMDFNS